MQPIKLNLGAGTDQACQLPDFIPVDRKRGGEIFPVKLPPDHGIPADDPRMNGTGHTLRPGTVDEIYASHCLEHLASKQAHEALIEWARLLKPGGRLRVAVPNFAWIAEHYLAGDAIPTAGFVMGGQTDADDFHRSIWDEEHLRQVFEKLGLTDIKPWKSEVNDCASLPVSLNLEGTKRADFIPEPPRPFPKTAAVMSVPRLMFTENVFNCLELAVSRRLPFEKVTGVFWGQCLERTIEPHLDDGTEWILTIDYDSIFSVAQFDEMCRLMTEHPEIDALAPLQVKRDESNLMMGLLQPDGTPYPKGTKITLEHFEPEVQRASWAHFGLTLLRVSALKKMKHPWFMAHPNQDGKWDEGRVDEDIYFWRNWAETGNTLYLANHVAIGHVQNIATFPNQELQPLHVYVNEWSKQRGYEGIRK